MDRIAWPRYFELRWVHRVRLGTRRYNDIWLLRSAAGRRALLVQFALFLALGISRAFLRIAMESPYHYAHDFLSQMVYFRAYPAGDDTYMQPSYGHAPADS